MQNSQATADRIKAVAKSKGISVSKLLLDCALNKNALFTMQSNGYYPRVEALVKIADYLGCSVDYLLGRDKYTPINQTTGDVNEGVVIGHATGDTAITVGTPALNKMEKELLRLFNSIAIKEQMKIMQQLYDIEENAQQNKKNTGVNNCE